MLYRRLGETDMIVSVVALGTWAMGKYGWGDDVHDEDSIAAIQRAIDLGINLIDTADVYGFGHAEEIVGRAIAGRRDEVFIATKGGLRWNDAGEIWRDSSREHLLAACDASLQRLGVDCIDLYQIHWPDPATPIQETMEALLELQEAGKIRYIGVSNYDVNQLREALKYAPVRTLQPPYSLLNRAIEKDLLPFCRDNNIGVLVYSPLQKGLLTGKYKPGDTFPEGDVRRNDPNFQGERFLRNLRIVERLKELAAESGHTVAQLAIAWAISTPGVTVALVGAKRPQQIEETAAAGDWVLDREMRQRIEEILREEGAE